MNDKITSLEIDGSQAWEVCRDIEFAGGCRVFTGSIDDLRAEGWNDRISSLRPAGFRGRGNVWGGNDRNRRRDADSRVVLYDRTNFRGQSRDITFSLSNIGYVGDNARSARVYGGTWELCDGENFTGQCRVVSANVSNLSSIRLNNRVRSARPIGRQPR